jgi:hypothetical protein
VLPLPESEVFTRADARALGWSDGAISRAIRAGRLTRVRHGRIGVSTGPFADVVAAVSVCAGSVASHSSGLRLHDLPIVGRLPDQPELTVPPRRIGSLQDAHLHRAGLPPDHLTIVNGIEVTTVARTLLDVARSRPSLSSVAAIDAALHAGQVEVDELLDVARFCRNWPGIRKARRAIALADGRAESPLESVSRLVFRWLQLPPPDLNPGVYDEFGNFIGRTDFYWDEFGVAGEADGRGKYDGRDVLTREKVRQEGLEDTELYVVRWGWTDITRSPRATKSRIEQRFERGRRRDAAGVRRRWSVRSQPGGQLPRSVA